MAKYRVELDDGRKFVVEADTQPSTNEVLQYINKKQPEQKSLIPEPISAMGRGIEQGVQNIPEQYRTPIQTALNTAKSGVRGILGATTPGGATTIEQPELASRTSLGIAAPIPTAVGFTGKKIAESEKGKQILSQAQDKLKTALPTTAIGRLQTGMAKSMTPEEFQQTGAGLAEVGGFLGTAALGNKIPIIKQDINQLKNSLSRFTLFKKPEFVLEQSNRINNIANNLEKESGKAIRDLFNGKIGDKRINADEASNALRKLPKNVLRAFSDTDKTGLFELEFESDGSLTPTARNMWKTRKFLDNFLTSKDYIDASKAEKKAILQSRRMIASILRNVDKSIAPIMDRFSKITKAVDGIKGVTETKGTTVANKLRNLVSSKGEPGLRKFFDNIAEIEPEIKNIMNEVIKFNRGQLLKKAAGGAVGGALLYEGIRRTLRGRGGDQQISGSEAGG